MAGEIWQNIRTVGPFFVLIWTVTIGLTVLRPQSYLNSLILMIALPVTMVFVAGLFGHEAGVTILMACFLMVMMALFLVPVLLIINGFEMIRREKLCLAHVLSLGMGFFITAGEVATVLYVFGLLEPAQIGKTYLLPQLISFTVFYFSFLLLSFVVYTAFIQIMPHRMNFRYVIIHGCGLAGGDRLTKLLSGRVDKAIEIYGKCKIKPYLIPSGGQGSDEKISEAEAMKDYLVSHGIPESSILPESHSTTTRENLMNSKAIIDARDGSKKTALVSSNYHVYRCLRLAKEVGLECTGIGARVASYFWPSAIIREFIAVFLTRPFMFWALTGYALFIGRIMFGIRH